MIALGLAVSVLVMFFIALFQISSIPHDKFNYYIRHAIVVSIENLTKKEHETLLDFILDRGYQLDYKRVNKKNANGTIEVQYLFMPTAFSKEKSIVRLAVRYMASPRDLMASHLFSDSTMMEYKADGYAPVNVLVVKYGVRRERLEELEANYLFGHQPFYVVCMTTPDKSGILSQSGKLPIMVTRKAASYTEACHNFIDTLIERDADKIEEIIDSTLEQA